MAEKEKFHYLWVWFKSDRRTEQEIDRQIGAVMETSSSVCYFEESVNPEGLSGEISQL